MTSVRVSKGITALISALKVDKCTLKLCSILMGVMVSFVPFSSSLAENVNSNLDTFSTSSTKPPAALRFAVPKLEKFPKAGTEMIRRMQEAMMDEYTVDIEPLYIPWYRLNLSVERGEAEFIVKTHVLEYEKYEPDMIRVDIPIISYNEIKITNRDVKVKSNAIGVMRGSMQEKTYCADNECILANSVSHLMTLFRYERVKSIIALEVLVAPEMVHFENYDLEYETVFTHYGYVFMFREYAKYKEGLERQFLQYWRKTETGYIWLNKD